jgi:mRNA-degrading endonuclease toxin of MazEF toxin-antitoxin module
MIPQSALLIKGEDSGTRGQAAVVLKPTVDSIDEPTVATELAAVNVSQIITLDKTRFTQRVERVPAHVLGQVEEGLRLVLGL